MSKTATRHKIQKRYVEATVYFTINHIPQADVSTLEKFLELINTNGNFGSITHQELLQKMGLLKKYIPETCEDSLMVLAELLGINWPMTTNTLDLSIPVMEDIKA